MKRFTYRRDDHRVICAKRLSRDYKGDFIGPPVDQLAAYEDTGLTPAQIRMQQGELVCLLQSQEDLHDRVKELESALADALSEREYFRSRADFLRELLES